MPGISGFGEGFVPTGSWMLFCGTKDDCTICYLHIDLVFNAHLMEQGTGQYYALRIADTSNT